MSTPFYDLASLVVVPSGYKASKVYAQKPLTTDGQLTFSRASTATRVNSAGLIETVSSNVPRLDYMNSTCPKLLMEPQRVNLLLQSSAFDNASWNKLESTVTANATASPDGTTNADSNIESATLNEHGVSQVLSISSGQNTISIYLKANGRTRCRIGFANSNFGGMTIAQRFAFFDISTGTVVQSISGGSTKIESAGNGWYRCTVSQNIVTGDVGAVQLLFVDSGTTTNYTGNGTSGIYLYGAQLEAGAYPTSLIPTTTAAVTRLADACSKTGISSLIGQTEGTIFAEIEMVAENGQIVILTSAAGNEVNRVQLYIDANRKIGLYRGDASVNIVSANAYAVGTTLKIAAVYKANDYALYVNGVSVGTDTSATAPVTPSVLYLGQYVDGSKTTTISAKQTLLFKTRLTNAQLAELTAL